MKKQLIIALLGCLLGLTTLSAAFGQADKKILYVGADLLRGVGKYNGLGFGAGMNARLQYPLIPNLALTAKVGVEYYKIAYYGYLPGYSSLGYGYNIITGWGFNTYNYIPGLTYSDESYGLSLPVTVGPRLYLPAVLKGLHTDLNVGADVAATKTMLTSLHVSPGVGYTLPLANGHFLDVTTSFVTNFKRGNGVVGLSVAYGLPIKF